MTKILTNIYVENIDPKIVTLDDELKRLLQVACEKTLSTERVFYEHLQRNGLDVVIDINLVTPDEIRAINSQQRQIDKVTDVLSFPAMELIPGELPPEISPQMLLNPLEERPALILGDIIICYEQAERQGELYGHGIRRELSFLTIHSCLHLLGYDHHSTDEELIMRCRQREVLRALNFDVDLASLDDREVAAGLTEGSDKFKAGFISISGQPNVGKSTLLNHLMQQKLAITSYKPQTTRHLIRGIVDHDDAQLVFIDSPGINKPNSHLGRRIAKAASTAIAEGDVILLLIDARYKPYVGKIEARVTKRAIQDGKPIILVINKIDLVAKEHLLELIKCFSEFHDYAAIIPISALRDDGLEVLLREIKKLLPVSDKIFVDGEFTDQSERTLSAELIRLQALRQLEDEVPHGVAVQILSFEEDFERQTGERRRVRIEGVIICDQNSHKGIIIGKKGKMIKSIGQAARIEIQEMLDCPCDLILTVKVSRNWQNQLYKLNELGYDNEKV